jgi:hypothetical protein
MAQHGDTRRDSASLMMNRLVTRLVDAVRQPASDHPMLRPTIFVPLKRGEDLSWKEVVARRV